MGHTAQQDALRLAANGTEHAHGRKLKRVEHGVYQKWHVRRLYQVRDSWLARVQVDYGCAENPEKEAGDYPSRERQGQGDFAIALRKPTIVLAQCIANQVNFRQLKSGWNYVRHN